MCDYYERIGEAARRGEEIYGVPTGFIDLDKLLRGLQPSDLLIIAGRPGQGKTGFLLSVAKNAALAHKKHVAIFSLEMSNTQVAERLISQQTGIVSQNLRTGSLDENGFGLLAEAVEKLSETHIFLDDTPAITPISCAQVPATSPRAPAGSIIVDYLRSWPETPADNRVQKSPTFPAT
jgi:replicative DNA helicase